MSENKSGGLTQVYITFIDVLFGVIVGTSFIGFYPITLEFKTFANILAYATVVASWVGYHNAFLKGLDKYRKPYRFVIDLILIYLYNYLILSSKDFPLMLLILPIIFGFYVLWEISRLFDSGRSKIKLNTVFCDSKVKLNTKYFILFLIQFAIYFAIYLSTERYGKPADLFGVSWLQWVLWISSMTLIIYFRVEGSKEPSNKVPSYPTNRNEVK